MTKAFINADLLSKTRPIPPFSSIQLFHKKNVCARVLWLRKTFLDSSVYQGKRHSLVITSYLLRHLFKIKIHILY